MIQVGISSRSSESSGSISGDRLVGVRLVCSGRSSRRSGSISGDRLIQVEIGSGEGGGYDGGVFGDWPFDQWKVVGGVEAIGRVEDFVRFEHTAKHLFDQSVVLTGLGGKFFGTKWDGTGSQDFEEGLSLG